MSARTASSKRWMRLPEPVCSVRPWPSRWPTARRPARARRGPARPAYRGRLLPRQRVAPSRSGPACCRCGLSASGAARLGRLERGRPGGVGGSG
jgi:hypothetical protein